MLWGVAKPELFSDEGEKGGGGAGARGDSAPHTGAPTPPTLPPGERGGGGGRNKEWTWGRKRGRATCQAAGHGKKSQIRSLPPQPPTPRGVKSGQARFMLCAPPTTHTSTRVGHDAQGKKQKRQEKETHKQC